MWTPCRLTTVQDSSPLNSQLEENCCSGRWNWARMKTSKQAGPADRWHQRCLSGGGLRTRIQSKLPVLLTTSAAGRSKVEMSAVKLVRGWVCCDTRSLFLFCCVLFVVFNSAIITQWFCISRLTSRRRGSCVAWSPVLLSVCLSVLSPPVCKSVS